MVSTNKNCQVECKKGANHIVRNKGKVHIFKPCDLDTAKSKIANAFPDDSVLPQPWVHPTLGVAYHSGETVLLAQPVTIPTSDTDTVTICPAAWLGKGITTCWLKHLTPDAKRAYAERKQAEAAALDPLPEPQVMLFLGSTCVVLTGTCVLWMFRVSIQSERGLLGCKDSIIF
jgi:hypothetical protein